MKITKKEENKYEFFLPKETLGKINFDNKSTLENYFQDFFLNLKDNYNFDVCGFYEIDIYIDNLYGAVISMKKEDIDYFDYFSTNIDMKISKPQKTEFLYKVKDIFFIDKKILKNTIMYYYKENYYLNLSKLTNKELVKLLEFSEIIYDETKEKIIKNGKMLKMEV